MRFLTSLKLVNVPPTQRPSTKRHIDGLGCGANSGAGLVLAADENNLLAFCSYRCDEFLGLSEQTAGLFKIKYLDFVLDAKDVWRDRRMPYANAKSRSEFRL